MHFTEKDPFLLFSEFIVPENIVYALSDQLSCEKVKAIAKGMQIHKKASRIQV